MGTATYTTLWWGSTELIIFVVVVVVVQICNGYLSYALISIVIVEFAIRSFPPAAGRRRGEREERREKVVLGAYDIR